MLRSILIAGEEDIRIPMRALGFAGFRRWLHSGSFPEEGLVSFINDQIEVDTSMEEFFEHGQVKVEITRVLSNLLRDSGFGRFAPDGTRYTNVRARVSTEPDGMVVSNAALKSGRVRLASGKAGRNTELIGTPDLIVEIISDSSVEKDEVRLMAAYFKARIPEYWLVDVRGGDIRFDIFTRKSGGYAMGRKSAGWVKSPVLGKSFRLTASADDDGHPEYTLMVR